MKFIFPILLLVFITSCSAITEKKKLDEDEELQKKFDSIDIPTIDKSLYASAVGAMDSGNYQQANQFFKQLIQKSPENTIYQLDYARLMRKSGKCQGALETLNKLESMESNGIDKIEVREEKALCLLSLGKLPQAGRLFTEIINQDSTRWKSINGAGLIFALKKKFNEANQYFDLAAEVSNYNVAVLNNQGLTKAIIGNYSDAISILRDAAIQAPEGTEQKRRVNLNLAMVYGVSGNTDMARNTAEPYLTEPQLYNNLGVYAELAKDQTLAKTYLNKALAGSRVYYDKAWENLERVEGR